MNALPPAQRGAGAGMLATFQNSASVLSIGVFFTLMIVGLASSLPHTMQSGLVAHGVPAADAARISHLPPVATLFASFLGYNPMATLLGPHVLQLVCRRAGARRSPGGAFFPQLISGPFHTALVYAFVFAIVALPDRRGRVAAARRQVPPRVEPRRSGGSTASSSRSRRRRPSTARTASCTLRIGEVAERVGVTTRTIRYYEELGLLGRSTAREQGGAPALRRGRRHAPAGAGPPARPARPLARGARRARRGGGGARRCCAAGGTTSRATPSGCGSSKAAIPLVERQLELVRTRQERLAEFSRRAVGQAPSVAQASKRARTKGGRTAVNIRWYGQSAFLLRGAQSVFIDPFGAMEGLAARGMQFDYPPIEGVEAELLLVTHEHGDHNAVEVIGGSPQILRSTAGTFDSPVGEVIGVSSEHDDAAGTRRGRNTIFCFSLDGLRVCHFGDFGQSDLRAEQQRAIGKVDVLFLPVGGGPDRRR